MYSRQAETFVQVVEDGSFAKAAERMYLSKVAVMNHVNAFEESMGAKLLVRTNHGVLLTDAGRYVYTEVKRIMRESAEITTQARRIEKEGRIKLRIGNSLMNPCDLLIELWEKIEDENRQFDIEVTMFDDNRDYIEDLLRQLGTTYDLMVGSAGSSRRQRSLCSFYQLGESKKAFFIPRSHPLAKKKNFRLEDLYGQQVMIVKRGDSPHNERLRDFLEMEHPQIELLDGPFYFDLSVFNECVRHGYILSAPAMWEKIHPFMVMRTVDWDYAVPVGLMYAKQPSKQVQAFIELIKKYGF